MAAIPPCPAFMPCLTPQAATDTVFASDPVPGPEEPSMSRARSLALVVAALAACLLPGLGLAAQEAAPPAGATVPVATLATPGASIDPYAGASAECRAAIGKALLLMDQGKWQSAFVLLAAFDPADADPWVLALKIEICLRGYVQTMMHRSFSLVDLAPGESLAALRAGEGQYGLFEFDPIAAATALEAAGTSAPPVLVAAIGDYYFAVQDLFSGKWELSDEELCSRALACLERTVAAGLANAETYTREGILLLRFEQPVEAESRLRAALALSPAYADAFLNLSMALGMQGRDAEACAALDAALLGYSDPDNRYMAYMLGARLAASSDFGKTRAYIAAAEKEFAGDPGPGLFRHLLALQFGHEEEADLAADAVLDGFPDSPYVVRRLLSDWLGEDQLDLAMAFLDRSLARMAGNDASSGVLGFYKALLVSEVKGSEGYAEVMSLLDAAEARFRKVYAADNSVFAAIAQLRSQLAAPSAPSAPSVPPVPANP